MNADFAGSRTLRVTDERAATSFPVWVLYPTDEPSRPVRFGPYTAEVSPDAPPRPGRFAVVVISHGGGGSHLLYRDLAVHLARHGFVVALPEHPGNNRNDNRLNDTLENLESRPRHVSLTLDALSNDAQLGPHVLADRAAVVGHSMGSYTALAVAGGTPWARTGEQVKVSPDLRVKALVLLAPAAAWFVPHGSLAGVTAPILMFSGDADTFTPTWHAELVRTSVADRSKVIDHRVASAGHYSFLCPFPASMKSPGFAPSVDPEGFDREAFHRVMNDQVLSFLDEALGASAVRPGPAAG